MKKKNKIYLFGFLISLFMVFGCVLSVSAATPIRLHFPDGHGGWDVVEQDFEFNGAGFSSFFDLETNSVVYDNRKTGDLEVLTIPYGWHFDSYTLDLDVLNRPSDDVHPVSYLSLPRYGVLSIWETNDIVYFDNVSKKNLTVYYPDSSGNMVSTVISGNNINIFHVYSDRIESEAGDILVSFGMPCDHYYEGVVDSYQSQQVPSGSVPVELSFFDGSISFYKFDKALDPPFVVNVSPGYYDWQSVSPYAKYRAFFTSADGDSFNVSLGAATYIQPYDFVPDLKTYTFRIKAYLTYDSGSVQESDFSNPNDYTGSLPVVDSISVDPESKLLTFKYLGFGSDAFPLTCQLLCNGVPVPDFKPEMGVTNIYDLKSYTGLNQFSIRVSNKFGFVTSPKVDFSSTFPGDDYGNFYIVGHMFDTLIDGLKTVKFYGISLWMFLCMALVINMIIPITWLILSPKAGEFTRGGNNHRRNNSGKGGDGDDAS